MSEFTLVVVDMQPGFCTALEELTVLGCQEQIKIAIQENNPIVFVEFNNYGKTISDLTNLTKNYFNTFFVSKSCDDGSLEVKHLIKEEKLPKRIKICGVNADYCVYQTAMNLLPDQHEVELVATAVNAANGLGSLQYVFNTNYKRIKIPILFESVMIERIKKRLAA